MAQLNYRSQPGDKTRADYARRFFSLNVDPRDKRQKQQCQLPRPRNPSLAPSFSDFVAERILLSRIAAPSVRSDLRCSRIAAAAVESSNGPQPLQRRTWTEIEYVSDELDTFARTTSYSIH